MGNAEWYGIMYNFFLLLYEVQPGVVVPSYTRPSGLGRTFSERWRYKRRHVSSDDCYRYMGVLVIGTVDCEHFVGQQNLRCFVILIFLLS